MPQRTNPFQRLVYLIQHQLATGATVTESKLLLDKRSRRSVEVDVVVEGMFGGTALVVGVECTARQRPATAEWVDQMLGKHSDLPVDKTVLVSRSGFTPEAKAKAEAHGAEALHVRDAEARDWSNWLVDVRNLRYATFKLHADMVYGTFVANKPKSSDGILVADSMIQEPGKPKAHSLNEYIMSMFSNRQLMPQLTEAWLKRDIYKRKEPLSFQLGLALPSGTTITVGSSESFQIQKIEVKVRAVAQDAPFSASVSKFREQSVVHGEVHDVTTDSGTSQLLFTLFEQDGKLNAGAALLIESGSAESRVLPLIFPTNADETDS